jgi:dethiobiotin synthetase
MRTGLFIPGTDTDVGQTYIACVLAVALRQQGLRVAALKPVATGSRADARALKKAAALVEPLERINPLYLRYPLAPLVSARLSGVTLDFSVVWDTCRAFKKKYDFTIVEGVGGLLVPLREDMTVLQMIRKIGFPVLVVARAGLGTINHTLMTVDKLRQQKVAIAGIALSGRSRMTLAEKTNPGLLREVTGLPVVDVPRNHGIDLEHNPWLIGA